MKPSAYIALAAVAVAATGLAVLAQTGSDGAQVGGLTFLGEPVTADPFDLIPDFAHLRA